MVRRDLPWHVDINLPSNGYVRNKIATPKVNFLHGKRLTAKSQPEWPLQIKA
ncbi:hypothetical protein HanIR_Chr13g0642321 [Helianthus annuus]|nr:hypothetical protein HanIR_Chr13g0642321 [Helianthus annuus]